MQIDIAPVEIGMTQNHHVLFLCALWEYGMAHTTVGVARLLAIPRKLQQHVHVHTVVTLDMQLAHQMIRIDIAQVEIGMLLFQTALIQHAW